MLSKLRYVLLFLALTVLHTCSHLSPIIKAKASLEIVNLNYTREMKFRLGYAYNGLMLWQAIVNSLIVMYGLWRCEREVEQQKQRHHDSVNPLNQAISSSKSFISPATEVKLNFLQTRNKFASSWQLFPKRVFALFTVPWSLTFLINGFFGYRTVHLVMQHFCLSQSEIFMLYFRIQLLYLQSWLPSDISHCLTKFKDGSEFLFATHSNLFTYQTDRLAGRE